MVIAANIEEGHCLSLRIQLALPLIDFYEMCSVILYLNSLCNFFSANWHILFMWSALIWLISFLLNSSFAREKVKQRERLRKNVNILHLLWYRWPNIILFLSSELLTREKFIFSKCRSVDSLFSATLNHLLKEIRKGVSNGIFCITVVIYHFCPEHH